jgi:hypothetical protein
MSKADAAAAMEAFRQSKLPQPANNQPPEANPAAYKVTTYQVQLHCWMLLDPC